MKQNQARDSLIRNIPLEVFNLLEESGFDVTLVTEDKEVLKNCKAIACSMRDFLKIK